jgi:DNA-binding response OmpR family regulator
MILVADNDQSIRELLEFNLKEAGFEAVTVDNGKDAVSVARCDHPELILMDMTMPVMDGVEACKILKGSPDTSDIPIIMLSARNDDADKVLSLELGADDYVTKPFSMRDLHARVRALLSETVVDLPEETVIEYGPFKINMDRFMALGVVEETTRRPMNEVNAFFEKLESLFAKYDFTKAQVVEAIKEFIPNFEHEEKGKNLDQKM